MLGKEVSALNDAKEFNLRQ